MSEAVPPPAPDQDAPQVTTLAAGKRKAALGFIFATVLMDVISLGIMIPVLPNLIMQMDGRHDYAAAVGITGVFGFFWGVMQFFCSPIQGMLSDRFGRRPVLLVSIFGLSIDYLFMAMAPTLAWLFIGRLINGATAASFSTAGAYIADISKPEDRAKNFGLIGAAFGVGFIVGPFIGGELGEIDLRLPFYAAAGLGAINWLYGLFILPESLPKERRQPKFMWSRANPVGSFKLLKTHHDLFGLAGVYFLFQLAHSVFPAIFVLFVGQRFGWGPQESGRMLMATGLANVITQAALVGPIVKKIGERNSLLVGLVFAIAGFMVFGLAPNEWVFISAVPVFALSALIAPGIQGLMTRRVRGDEQGQLQGANSGMMAIATIIGPILYPALFAFAITHQNFPHGLPMLIASSLLVAALLLALQVAKPAPATKPTA